MFRFLRWLIGLEQAKPPATPGGKAANVMNHGDFHSGPAGYSPNTAYPETQYGSGFDLDADWADGEN